jgi:hypothetical protein
MSTDTNKILAAAVLRLLRPLIRILLRNGVTYGAFADLVKRVFVDVAEKEEFALPGRKQTVSRISVITGLSRKEVSRVQQGEAPDDSAVSHQYNRAARVITGWNHDAAFSDIGGIPLVLPFDGDVPSFGELVKQYSGDMPARAVLDELLRVGAVEQNSDGRLRLLARAYVPLGDEEGKLNILGTDVGQLISTIDHNLQNAGSGPRFQRKVAYDNLPEEVLPQLRELSAEKSQALLVELNRWMRQHDRDTNPASEGSGRKRAGIGIYYFEEDVQEDRHHEG